MEPSVVTTRFSPGYSPDTGRAYPPSAPIQTLRRAASTTGSGEVERRTTTWYSIAGSFPSRLGAPRRAPCERGATWNLLRTKHSKAVADRFETLIASARRRIRSVSAWDLTQPV